MGGIDELDPSPKTLTPLLPFLPLSSSSGSVFPSHLIPSSHPFPQEGKLEVFDLGASTRSYVEDAHEGPVWSLAPLPDRTGFVSGSADKTVKFWQWKVVVAADGAKQLR